MVHRDNYGNCRACRLIETLRRHLINRSSLKIGKLGWAAFFITDVQEDFDREIIRNHGTYERYWSKRIGNLKRCLEEPYRSGMNEDGIEYVERTIELLERIHDAGGVMGR